MNKLEPGILLPVEYVRAVDGDTIEVELRRKFKIRLRNIDVYEPDTEKGKEATEYVDMTLSLSSNPHILVFIPTNDPTKLMDITSFERIVGDIYVQEENLAEILKDHGYNK